MRSAGPSRLISLPPMARCLLPPAALCRPRVSRSKTSAENERSAAGRCHRGVLLADVRDEFLDGGDQRGFGVAHQLAMIAVAGEEVSGSWCRLQLRGDDGVGQ